MGDTVSNTEKLPSSSPLPIRIITHNVRFATDNAEKHERLWENRLHHLTGHFKYHTRQFFSPQSTLVCMQEVLHGQLQDLSREAFGSPSSAADSTNSPSDWIHVGVGRDDGKTKGEYSPIFLRQSAWKCIHTETVWLNESGEVGKKGWDASSIRIVTCAVLESQASSNPYKTILALNTHLDDQGEIARREAAKLILQVATRLQFKYLPHFTFLTGDLNSEPTGDAYHVLNASGSGFVDARRLIADHGNADGKIYAYGNELTFTGFDGDGAAKGKQRIDFVHLGISKSGEESTELENAKQMVQGYGVLPSRFDDEVWLSDHRAVVVDLLV
ncbi:Endonuclease/exonuclease/phosphatase [Exophiala viscosa]|uniref:Endonuclease/exonuclease/phosphatase n=1 Tax=Exophiala viscosa TaxID=2486360 RepID=UPI00218FF564|nr:Endonuclease/exonuclease/phosphatase [Exophiala viscosa]